MAGPIQAGDIIAFANLAWDIYNLGFTDSNSASRQFQEFLGDLYGLGENLDRLSQVINQAAADLRRRGAYNAQVRWDPSSVRAIVGNWATLEECETLIKANRRYVEGNNAARNIQYNVVLQPQVNKLMTRLHFHNSKLLLLLKPFEIDISVRVQQDLAYVTQRIDQLGYEFRRFIERNDPVLARELEQQEHNRLSFLPIPWQAAEEFSRVATTSDPSKLDRNGFFSLEDLSDAIVYNYDRSSKNFQGGALVSERVPPVEQYINLLKCIWLLDRIRQSLEMAVQEPLSHWPSYIRRLQETVAEECDRYRSHILQPDLSNPYGLSMALTKLTIWPVEEGVELVDVAMKQEEMEKLLDVPLYSSQPNIQKHAQLFRVAGSNNRRFRLIVSGAQLHDTPQQSRDRKEMINFNLSRVLLVPQYALPDPRDRNLEFILQSEGRIFTLPFMDMNSVLRFQQAVTGWKAWAGYTAYNVDVDFVEDGKSRSVKEKACVQLWYTKEIPGIADIDGEADGRGGDPRRWSEGGASLYSPRMSIASGAPNPGRGSVMLQPSQSPTPWNAGQVGYGSGNRKAPETIFELPADVSARLPPPRNQAPPVELEGTAVPIAITPASNTRSRFSFSNRSARASLGVADASPRSKFSVVDTSPNSRFSVVDTSPNSRFSILSSPPPNPPASSLPSRFPPPIPVSPPTPPSLRVSEALSHQTSSYSLGASGRSTTRRSIFSDAGSSSSSGDTKTLISTGTTTSGVLHTPPSKPLLVLFTRNQGTGKLSICTIKMDMETDIVPERCNCRRTGAEGKRCTIVSIEKQKGGSALDARRWDKATWNLAPVATSSKLDVDGSATEKTLSGGAGGEEEMREDSEAKWPRLKRITLQFPSAEDRVRFGGKRNECNCKVRTKEELQWCLTSNHRGLWGEVKDFYRKKGVEYHEGRYGGQQSVVWGRA